MSTLGRAAKTPVVLSIVVALILGLTAFSTLGSLPCAAAEAPMAAASADDPSATDPPEDESSGTDPSEDDPSATDPSEEEPEPQPVVSAQLSDDERVVVLRAQDPSLVSARAVAFNVWSERGGRARAIKHGAVQLDDGSWSATIYIASPTPLEPGVPYNCRIDHAIHRLYNPNNGQHLLTGSVHEADTLSKRGWTYEGVAWVDVDAMSGTAETLAQPVYRLYNPSTAEHFYTSDAVEYAMLPQHGWRQEGISFHSDPDEAQPIYRLYNPNDPAGLHHFTSDAHEYAVLALQGWRQEGVSWCGAAANADGSWSLTGGNRPHNDPGTYQVEASAVFPGGAEGGGDAPGDEDATLVGGDDATSVDDPSADDGAALPDSPADPIESIIGQTSFTVSTPTATAAIANVNENLGTFDIIIGNVRSVSGVVYFNVPVWAADDRGDRREYRAVRQADGTYRVSVRAQDHRALTHYNIQVTLQAVNGIREDVAQTTYDLKLVNFVYFEGGPNIYTLSIINVGPVASVTMPTWSEANGQDDLVWYQAVNRGDRWSATIDTGNFLDSGRCISHIYADGQCLRGFEFNVSPKEVLTLRQRAILKAAREVPTLGGGLCAGWVSTVLMRAGQPYNMTDDANDMYYRLPLTDLNSLLPGMAIAVATHGHTVAGSIWGHVGIYLGNNEVIDDAYGAVRVMPLDQWVAFYTDRVPVHFGFLEY